MAVVRWSDFRGGHVEACEWGEVNSATAERTAMHGVEAIGKTGCRRQNRRPEDSGANDPRWPCDYGESAFAAVERRVGAGVK